MTEIERTIEPLTQDEIEGGLTTREQSLALVAERVAVAIDSREAVRQEWARHERQHGPTQDEHVLQVVAPWL